MKRLVFTVIALALLSPPWGGTAGAATDAFRIARLKYGGGGDWYSNPSSLPNLMRGLGARTSIRVDETKEARVELLDEALFSYPLVYMNGHGEVRFSPAEVERLRDYLLRGGFLWADDNYGMDRAFRREIAKVFPEAKLVELPFQHELFRAFYALPNGTPKVHEHDGKPPQTFGIFHEGRLVVIYTYECDIGDGLEDPEVHKDPEPIREEAMRYAVNLVVYVLTH
jgi:hypothetical protein